MRFKLGVIFLFYGYSMFQHHLLKRLSFLFWLNLRPCQKSVVNICVSSSQAPRELPGPEQMLTRENVPHLPTCTRNYSPWLQYCPRLVYILRRWKEDMALVFPTVIRAVFGDTCDSSWTYFTHNLNQRFSNLCLCLSLNISLSLLLLSPLFKWDFVWGPNT